jgi:hypothetical protein
MFKKVVIKRDGILAELLEKGSCQINGYVMNHVDGYRFGREFYWETLPATQKVDFALFSAPVLVLQRKQGGEGGTLLSPPKDNCSRCVAVPEKEFWLLGRDYSQRAEIFSRETWQFLCEAFAHTGYAATGRHHK